MPPAPFRLASSSRPSGHAWLLGLALIVWIVATTGAIAWVVKGSLGETERSFAEYGELFHAQLRDKLRANEAVLYGFATFLGAIPRDDHGAARQYARAILERYPHIYMLEVVRRVPQKELDAFTQQMRRKGYRNFEVRQFDYRGDREWQSPAMKSAYYPVILAEPDSDAARSIIGLDIDSLTGLRAALIRSEKQGTPAASEVFRLVEGDDAYVLFRPIAAVGDTSRQHAFGGVSYALMVLRARDLMPPPRELDAAIGHLVRFHVGQDADTLYAQAATREAPGQSWFRPLRFERHLGDLSQPASIVLQRPVGLSDISGVGLVTVSLASMFSLTLLLGYIGNLRQREQRREEELKTIEHLALHDALTGLPNRFLLLGRLEQVITSAQRHGTKIGVMFLDLDGFKPINDRYGHHVGDALLREVGWRLRQCMRDSDTVARHGGDEFVVVLTDMQSASDAAPLAEKILGAIAEPLDVNGDILQVTTSIGIAVFPDSGLDAESLLRAADAAMYEAKAEGRRIFRYATPGVSVSLQAAE